MINLILRKSKQDKSIKKISGNTDRQTGEGVVLKSAFNHLWKKSALFADQLDKKIEYQGYYDKFTGFTNLILSEEVEKELIEIINIVYFTTELMKITELFYAGELSEKEFMNSVKELHAMRKNDDSEYEDD